MQHDWSNEWLQKVAGWKAVKAGLSLYDRGLVRDAEFQGDVCCGSVGSSKFHRVKVTRTAPMLAETRCSCLENQRSGAMCEHAVAVITAARSPKLAVPKVARLEPTTLVAKVSSTKSYRIDLFPRWQDEWKNGRLTISITELDQQPSDHDELIHSWVTSQGLVTKKQPWVLPLSGNMLLEFLPILLEQERVFIAGDIVDLNGRLNQLFVKTQRVGDLVEVLLLGETGQFLGGKAGDYVLFRQGIHRLPTVLSREFYYLLFTGKWSKTTVNEFITANLLDSILLSTDPDDWLNQLKWKTLEPTWHIELDGSLQNLELRIHAELITANNLFKRPFQTLDEFLIEEEHWIYEVSTDASHKMSSLLLEQGWIDAGDRWLLQREEDLLRFFEEGRANLRAESASFVETPRLARVTDNLLQVSAHLDVKDHSSRELSVAFVYRISEGKQFDPQKIQQLLRSGKRLIQTNDGKTLLLPKESWETFILTARELQLSQQQGRFLASKSHQLVFNYLREYYDKSLILSDKNIFNRDDFTAAYPLVKATLRDYQGQGVLWLQKRLNEHHFALLADEMGLGKTLQTISLLTNYGSNDRPALVVVPKSLLQNWLAEIQKFAPSLKAIVLHGEKRDGIYQKLDQYQVIVTSYGVLVNDRVSLMKRQYSLMVVDEASMIRNPDTEIARACFRIQADRRLALTGTPLENSYGDLWSIFQFLQPGYLGERTRFRELYEKQNECSQVARESLRLRISPFILRRTKDQVAKDLPEKIEIDEWCELSPEQQALYKKVMEDGLVKIDQLVQQSDKSAPMQVLTLLLRLRQICCDVSLYSPDLLTELTLEQRSAKTERLLEIVKGTLDSGRKMLVFSQFAKQLHLIEAELNARSIPSLRLDGATKNRQDLVNKFQLASGPPVFLISLKAGGYGLNLTAATTVVHFDPWWNPAAAQQASDRAHRIGQQHAVSVYQLLTRGTVEDRVKKLQHEKSALAQSLFGNKPQPFGKMPNMQEISDLLRL